MGDGGLLGKETASAAWEHIAAGDRLVAQGQEAEAIEFYRAAVAASPSFAEAHRRLAVALYKHGEFGPAEEAARRATKLNSESVEAWFTLGVILRDAREPAGALQAFERALALQPTHVEALRQQGRLLFHSGRAQEALRVFQQAVELAPNSVDVAHDLAIAHVACRQWREAEAAFKRCIELEPDNAELYYELGHAHEYDVTTPDEEAEAAYRRAVELNPAHLPAQFRLAVLWARRRQSDPEARQAALHTLRQMARRDDLAALFADAHLVYYLLGAILDDEEDNEHEAAAAYQECLRLRPRFAPAHNNLGVLARRRGALDEAAAHFARAVIADSGYDQALRNLCRVLYDQPNELAVRELREIMDLIPAEAPDVIARMMGHMIDAAKAEAYASSYDKVHEVKNLIGVLGARMRKVLSSERCQDVPEGPELLEMQGRAFEAIRRYLEAIQEAPSGQEMMDCGEVLRKTMRQMAVVRPAGVQIEMEIRPDLPALTGDSRRLGQLFRNLIANAFEAMPDGGTLRITAERIHSDDGRSPGGLRRGVRIVFEDTGVGMSDEELRRARDPGFTTKPTGSGYGLAIASQVVREHGGTLELMRGSPGGIRAVIELPERPQPEAVPSRLRLRPVIIEDWQRLVQAEVDAVGPGDGRVASDIRDQDAVWGGD